MLQAMPIQFRPWRILAALLLLLATVGAAGVSTGQAGESSSASGAGQALPPLPAGCERIAEFDPDNFSKPTRIDNRFLSLPSGTRFVFEGRANRGGGALPHRVTFTVTDLYKKINGVRTRVLWDVDENEGEIVEAELAFFAQDDVGNVWNFGEYPEEFEGGEFVGAPNTWIAGVNEAEAGVHMLARPRVGVSHMQGYSPDIEFLDCATVVQRKQTACAPLGCFSNALIVDETSPLDPEGGLQRKSYAPRVGNVQIAALDDPEGETLVLTEVVRLDKEARAEARKEARKLNEHAYEVSDVYRQTRPMKRSPGKKAR